MADLVKLGTSGPWLDGQLYRARQFAQFIDVAVEFLESRVDLQACKLGVIMVIAVSCVKLLSAHNSTQHTSRKHKV